MESRLIDIPNEQLDEIINGNISHLIEPLQLEDQKLKLEPIAD